MLGQRILLAFLLLVSPSLLFLEEAWAKDLAGLSPAETIGLSSYQFEATFQQFQTTSRYDVEGQEEPLVDNEDFLYNQADFVGTYGWGEKLDFFAGARYRQVRATLQNGDELTNSGIESVYGGFKYALDSWGKFWKPAIEVSFRHTLYGNTEYESGQAPSDEIILGDNGNAFSVGLHLVRERFWEDFELRGFAAYRRPPNDLSQEIPYDVSLFWKGESWIFGGGVDGIFSMGMDDYASNPESKPPMSTGPTNLYNSINRERMGPYGQASYKFSPNSKLTLRASQVMAGASTDKGLRYLLSFSWGKEGITKEDRKVEKFKEYVVEATVMKISPRGKFVRIDHGLAQDVKKGMRFDIYQTDYFGGNVLVASGRAHEVEADWSIIRLNKRYNKTKIEKGFAARGY